MSEVAASERVATATTPPTTGPLVSVVIAISDAEARPRNVIEGFG
jgi:hypothetical protein